MQFAEEFGVDPELAVELLRWQSDLAEHLEELRSLPSYAYAEIVNPTKGSLGGLDVYLNNPTVADTAFIDSIPSPPIGEKRTLESEITSAEAEALVAAEKQSLRSEHGPDVFVIVDVDWEAGTVIGRIDDSPPPIEAAGCAMSDQTGGYAQGGRAASWVTPTDCNETEGQAGTSGFSVYFNGKQGILTSGHLLTEAFGIPTYQHFVSDTSEGLEVRCINPCSSALKGYYNNDASSTWSRSRAYASLRPYYNDNSAGWDDYAVWRERYASTNPSGRIYVVPGGPNAHHGFTGGYYSIYDFDKDSEFPLNGSTVCQAAQEHSTGGGGLFCGTIAENPSSYSLTSSDRAVSVDYFTVAGKGPMHGASGGPWFQQNTGLGIFRSFGRFDGVDYGFFERIEPIFIQLKNVWSSSRLYCMNWYGQTVTCVP
jgi:hypothetical protein